MKLTKEALAYWNSIENEKGTLSHLKVNDPKIQRLRAMIGIDPEAKTGNLINSNRVRELIKEKGLSQQRVAKRMGYYPSWLTTVLSNGRVAPERMEKIARILDVEVEEIQG